jgi:uncharacterized protein YecE (DUF72 family)
MPGRLRIGTSGWNYKAWAGGVFYPEGLSTARWLDFYSQQFGSVEVNNTFYRLPEQRVFESWRDETPKDFVFAVKASRFITHMKKLADPQEHVALFLDRASGLGSKLELVLFQLPPFWKFNAERLAALGQFLSRQTIVRPLRVALEIRNPTWMTEACVHLLREHNIALVFADWPSLKLIEPVTADFVFVRRHGPAGLYSSSYTEDMLREEANRIQRWRAEGRDVYIYYNNDVCGFAPKNALSLQELLS